MEELGFEASGEVESDVEDALDAEDIEPFSNDSSDEEGPGRNRTSNAFILSCSRVAPSNRKTPHTVQPKRKTTPLHALPSSTCYLHPLRMLVPSPPPICPPSPLTPSPPPQSLLINTLCSLHIFIKSQTSIHFNSIILLTPISLW